MDRCALFVDAGYVLADGAMAVHGTRRRDSVSWDYPGLLQLLASMAMERSRLPLLRCYWYDATVEGRRTPDHDALADLPGVKLRVARTRPGRGESVAGEIQRDLTTLARNKAVGDAMVVSAEEDLAQVISDVQDMGMRVTLLNVAADGNWAVSRALRQECDDIVEISAAHLRPYAELISGAEPPRPDERGGMLALGPAANGNGQGNGYAMPGRVVQAGAQPSAQQPQSASVQSQPAQSQSSAAAEFRPAVQSTQAASQSRSRGEEQMAARDDAKQAEVSARQDFGQPDRAERADGAREPDYGVVGDYGAASSDYSDYGTVSDHGPSAEYGSIPDYMPAPEGARDAQPVRQEPARQDYGAKRVGARPEFPPRAEQPARDEMYAAPVAVQLPAEGPTGDRPSARPRQDDLSGYNPGAVRDQFQPEAAIRETLAGDAGDRYQPVPIPLPASAGAAQVRRLPSRGGGQPGPAAGQPSLGQPGSVPPSLGQPSLVQPGPGQAAQPALGLSAPAGGRAVATDAASGDHPIAPVVPMDQAGVGYADVRGGAYGGPRQGSGDQPVLSPVVSGPHAAQQDAGGQAGPIGHGGPVGPGAYSGAQSGVSLGDAVQSAHEEGQAFGESVARDAPALWLEAVLARKPRMPSDLEARLLQGSALPIDFLLHDEVRHALRRGFWDALERSRR